MERLSIWVLGLADVGAVVLLRRGRGDPEDGGGPMPDDGVVLVLVAHVLVPAVLRDLRLSEPPADGGIWDGSGNAGQVDRDLLPGPLPVIDLLLKSWTKLHGDVARLKIFSTCVGSRTLVQSIV